MILTVGLGMLSIIGVHYQLRAELQSGRKPARPQVGLNALIDMNADYPSGARRYDEEGTTRIELSIGVAGRVDNCTIVKSSGSPSLDSASCRLMQERARFLPAADRNGRPVTASFTHDVIWEIPLRRPPPDATFSLSGSAEIPDDCHGQAWVWDQDARAALSYRGVHLVELGLQMDAGKLVKMVSSSAEFQVWDGDTVVDLKKGPRGAMEFARWIKATNFTYAAETSGPFRSDLCARQSSLVWFSNIRNRGYVVRFDFDRGLLVAAIARNARVENGQIKRR